MSEVLIAVPKEYGYVVATTACTFFLNIWHGIRTTRFRVKADLKHPKTFADTAEIAAANPQRKKELYLFNCAQRAHNNYSEVQPSAAIALLITGLIYPRTSTVLGVTWLVGRVIFALGYTRADKDNGSGRMVGFAIQFPMLIALWGLAGWTGIKMVM